MTMYRFARFGTLLREDGLPLYSGRTRISKPPRIVWWWPVNWIVFVAVTVAVAPTIAAERWKLWMRK